MVLFHETNHGIMNPPLSFRNDSLYKNKCENNQSFQGCFQMHAEPKFSQNALEWFELNVFQKLSLIFQETLRNVNDLAPIQVSSWPNECWQKFHKDFFLMASFVAS